MNVKDESLLNVYEKLNFCLNTIKSDLLQKKLQNKGVSENDYLFMKNELMSLLTTCMMRIDYVDKKIK